eukprot:TRINITY_DN2039_c2_g1_i2.p1 TRINITY_DN2039_c2_g1~~TRINITY_DN2039_c2_g1_i2.p1  ORF type:complete len:410 (+),score=86.98 TRINITY_DN2039_c2_g1_i2:414-1643(+)
MNVPKPEQQAFLVQGWSKRIRSDSQKHKRCPDAPKKNGYLSRRSVSGADLKLEVEEEYTFLSEIGEGDYATIHKAVHIETAEMVAIKEIRQRHIPVHFNQRKILLYQEYYYGNILSFENVLKYYRSWVSSSKIYMSMELCNEDLKQYVQRTNDLSKREDLLWKFLIDMLKGLNYIHSFCLVHLDIKPANILIVYSDSIPTLKIGDLGILTHLDDWDSNFASSSGGEGTYIAPEILSGEHIDQKVDMFSLGIIILELGMDLDIKPQHGVLLREGNLPPNLDLELGNFAHITRALLSINPLSRPHASEVLMNGNVQHAAGSLDLSINIMPPSTSAIMKFSDEAAHAGIEKLFASTEAPPRRKRRNSKVRARLGFGEDLPHHINTPQSPFKHTRRHFEKPRTGIVLNLDAFD